MNPICHTNAIRGCCSERGGRFPFACAAERSTERVPARVLNVKKDLSTGISRGTRSFVGETALMQFRTRT